jgi:hypothetical protein
MVWRLSREKSRAGARRSAFVRPARTNANFSCRKTPHFPRTNPRRALIAKRSPNPHLWEMEICSPHSLRRADNTAMNTAEHHEEDDLPGWLQLVLSPCLLVEIIRQLFADQGETLRQKRRIHEFPSDWQDLLPDLQNAEWPIFALKAEGARRILNNEPLDLDRIAITAPPPNQLWIPPTSAQQMHLRILAMNRFHADPERFIRRHAARIRRAAEQGAAAAAAITIRPRNVWRRTAALASQPAPARAAAAVTTTSLVSATHRRAGLRVRAPPWADRPCSPLSIPSLRSSGIAPARPRRPAPGHVHCPKAYPQEPVSVAFCCQIGVTTNPRQVLPMGRPVLCDSFGTGPAR